MSAPIGGRITAFCFLNAHMVHTKASVHTHGDVYSIAFRSGRRRFSLETFRSQLHRNVRDAMKLDMCTRKPESTGIVGIAQLGSGRNPIQAGWRHSRL